MTSLIDIEQLQVLKDNLDKDTLNELIDLFKSSTIDLIDSLKNHIENNNFASIKEDAHALKGSAANIGALFIKNCALDIENDAATQNIEKIKNNMEKIINNIDTSIEQLNDFFNK